jgi:hypothetical protein
MFKLIRWVNPARLAVLLAASSWLITGRAAETEVIINEIMYHPPLDLEELQYVELYNRGTASVDLSKWSFTKGLKFVFPEQTQLASGAYLVVCRNRTVFSANYGQNIAAVGNFTGKLSHRGEKIELSDAAGNVVDAVKYADTDPWPAGPDGHSASLERICPSVTGKEPGNWAGSLLPPTQKPAGTPGRKNDNFATNLPPIVSGTVFKTPRPQEAATVTTEIADADGVQGAVLLWWVAKSGGQMPENQVPMQRVEGNAKKGTYRATIPGQPASTLIRFRIKAANASGSVRFDPAPNEPHPAYSYSTFINSNTARIPFVNVVNVSPPRREGQIRVWDKQSFQVPAPPTRGNSAFIYMPPDGGQVLTLDYVYVRQRKGGFKAHFTKDQPFQGMTGINVIFESSPRWLLSEPLAYELYRLAGVPAPLTEHLRVWMDGRPLGYQLLIEQPNKAFLRRNQRDDTGYMYKANYFGNSLTGQHEKKTRPASGYDDLITLYNGLSRRSGAGQWEFIQQNFNIEEFTGYYAVNMCIQNWDGFFNNHFLYHDSARTGKWEIYPWDEDKTWGDFDGASSRYDWYTMPLTFGMQGDQAPGWSFGGWGNGWWRPPGWFSGPLLANAGFRRAFLTRLGGLCADSFTEEKIIPLIDALEKRLEPEIPVRAQLVGDDPRRALATFHSDIQSLRNQVKFRRQAILAAIPNDRAAR